MTELDKKDDDVILAAEYALHLLEGDDRVLAYARTLTDPDFAREVVYWGEHFGSLSEEFKAVRPRNRSKSAVMKALFSEEKHPSFLQNIRLWQGLSVAMLALVALLSYQLLTPVSPEVGQFYVTELASENDALRILAVYDGATGRIQVTRTNGTAAEGRAFELWGISGDNPPISIGVLPQTANGSLILPPVLAASIDGLVLAISDEPPGGSPTGQPTGAVLAVGQVSEI